jgi:hypothetical protein
MIRRQDGDTITDALLRAGMNLWVVLFTVATGSLIVAHLLPWQDASEWLADYVTEPAGIAFFGWIVPALLSHWMLRMRRIARGAPPP